jgi:Subunit 21 of Mediator complex
MNYWNGAPSLESYSNISVAFDLEWRWSISLSLAMFEALRGLRDAVAPESGNLGGNNNASSVETSEPDFEEFWTNYRSGDAATVALVNKVSGSMPPQRREDMARIHARIEMEKDAELVTKLASDVLEKSDKINESVSSLPGMQRTRTQQMEYIATLLQQNKEVAADLEESYAVAKERREKVRQFVRGNTCNALGIVEGDII